LTANYDFLIQKLDAFIKKFYLNQLMRGAIYSFAVLVASVLIFSLLEYFGNFGTGTRLLFFWAFLLGNLSMLGWWVAIPLLAMARIGKQIDHKTAAHIIGAHFGQVRDKLLNTLELRDTQIGSQALIEASIQQKMAELKPIPFNLAINLGENRRYLKYALIPLGIVLLLLVQVPEVILSSSARILSYNRAYLPEAPFEFVLLNDKLEVLRHSDVRIKLQVRGKELPQSVRVVLQGQAYRMTREGNSDFEFLLRNVDSDADFYFEAVGFRSGLHTIKVLPKPLLRSFTASVEYPPYVGRNNEKLSNIGDFIVPEGTIIKWTYETENAKGFRFNWNGKYLPVERLSSNTFSVGQQVFAPTQYYVGTYNDYLPNNDSVGYGIQVIKDLHPSLGVEMVPDTGSLKSFFFSGELSDDYGITALTLNYRFSQSEREGAATAGFQRVGIPVSRSNLQGFFYHWDLRESGYQAGDVLEFYFEVWDNDAVNGHKSTRSKTMTLEAPTGEELKTLVAESSSSLKERMEMTMKEAAELQKELAEVEQRVMEKEQLDWDDKKALEKLLERQESLKNEIGEVQKDYKEMMKQQDEFGEMDEKLREKHEMLMKLFEQLMDEDTKKLFEELEELLQQNQEDVKQELEDMKIDQKELEKELDAALEHFKQLELEQKMQEAIDKLDELSKKQEELAEKTEKGQEDPSELAKEQDALNQEFDELRKEMDELDALNQELENPNDLENTDALEDEIESDMKGGSEELGKGKNNKAGEKQKDAKEKMDELKKKMEDNMAAMEMESLEMDYESLRRLAENLLYLSLEQEKLIDELGEVHSYNPRFVELGQRQMKLRGDAKMIEDSLLALAKRVMQISGFVTKEVGELNRHMDKNIEYMSQREIASARREQQYVMTHANNLAVMLSEVMDQLQQQMAQQMSGEQNCSKPGSKKMKGKKGEGMDKKLGNMRQMQENLKNQIGEMKGRMDKGQRPLSKELAKAAAQQEALRRELQKLQEMQEGGEGSPSKELKEIEDLMDKAEEDIVNSRLTNETLKRQQEIITKLLDSEKAAREQEWDDTRESITGEQVADPSKKAFEQYKRERLKEIELLNTVPPQLNGYYKQKVKRYFDSKE
jgi:hypothetical protein